MVDRSMPALLRNLRKRVTSVERRLTKVSAKTNWADLSPLIIPESSLPSRLRTPTVSPGSLDTVYDTGWYSVNPSTTGVHPPYQSSAGPGYWAVEVINVGGRSIQVARPWAATGPVWQRWRNLPGDGSWTAWDRIDRAAMSGPAALRTLTRANYWDFWYETDTRKVMVGNRSGGWRQYAGTVYVPSRAWDTTQAPAGIALAGRTDNITLPTILENNEDVIIWARAVGSGFGSASVSVTTRNPANTVVSLRLMQIMSTTVQPFTIGWQVSPVDI